MLTMVRLAVLNAGSGTEIAVYERDVSVWTFSPVHDIHDDGAKEILVQGPADRPPRLHGSGLGSVIGQAPHCVSPWNKSRDVHTTIISCPSTGNANVLGTSVGSLVESSHRSGSSVYELDDEPCRGSHGGATVSPFEKRLGTSSPDVSSAFPSLHRPVTPPVCR